jgi:hypothetical protein
VFLPVFFVLRSFGFNIRNCLLFGFNRSRQGVCCELRRRLFRFRHLTGGFHFLLIRYLRDLLREGLVVGEGVVAQTTRPFGIRGSTPLPGPSAQQRAWTASLSGREVCL